jgi:hypothetical protein
MPNVLYTYPLPPIMKTRLIIILLGLGVNVLSQSSTDSYNEDDDFVNFIADDSIEFKVSVGEGFTSDVYGYGSFKTKGNRIIVHTIHPISNKHSNYIIKDTIDTDKIELQAFLEKRPLVGGNVILQQRNSDKVIQGKITDENGYATFKDLNSTGFEKLYISISGVGYGSSLIPVKNIKGKSIKIILSPYLILDNKKVIFKKKKRKGKELLIGPIIRD